MHGTLARDMPHAFIPQGTHVKAVEKTFSGTKQYRPDREMQLVYQARLQILTDAGDTAAEAYIAVAGGRPRPFPGGVDTFGDEKKLRAARHLERRARVMRQYEHRRVIWRFLAPPSPPAFVRPRTANRTEHIAPQNPGADAGEALLCHVIVHAGFAAIPPLDLPPCARMEKPFH